MSRIYSVSYSVTLLSTNYNTKLKKFSAADTDDMSANVICHCPNTLFIITATGVDTVYCRTLLYVFLNLDLTFELYIA